MGCVLCVMGDGRWVVIIGDGCAVMVRTKVRFVDGWLIDVWASGKNLPVSQ